MNILYPQIPFHYSWERDMLEGVSNKAMAASLLWNENLDFEHMRIFLGALTAEESENVTSRVNDINTLSVEFATKVIIGEESLDNWDNFVANVESMGLDEILKVYQTAYERYQAR